MAGFGFLAPQGAPQQQPQAPGPVGTMPLGQTNTLDPRSIYLQQALQQLGKQPQGNAMGLDANLMADALDQYALKQRQPVRPPVPQGVNPVGPGNPGIYGGDPNAVPF